MIACKSDPRLPSYARYSAGLRCLLLRRSDEPGLRLLQSPAVYLAAGCVGFVAGWSLMAAAAAGNEAFDAGVLVACAQALAATLCFPLGGGVGIYRWRRIGEWEAVATVFCVLFALPVLLIAPAGIAGAVVAVLGS